jgi:hypothetical protein
MTHDRRGWAWRLAAQNGKGCALVLLRRTEEGMNVLEAINRRCLADAPDPRAGRRGLAELGP